MDHIDRADLEDELRAKVDAELADVMTERVAAHLHLILPGKVESAYSVRVGGCHMSRCVVWRHKHFLVEVYIRGTSVHVRGIEEEKPLKTKYVRERKKQVRIRTRPTKGG